jgi:hypothetical protein
MQIYTQFRISIRTKYLFCYVHQRNSEASKHALWNFKWSSTPDVARGPEVLSGIDLCKI